MKIKYLPVLLAALMITACNNSSDKSSSAASSSTPATTSVAPSWKYLDFLSGDKAVRIDLFGIQETGLQISYGDAALVEGANNTTLNDNSLLSVNKSLDHAVNFNAVFIAEKQGDHEHGNNKVHKNVEGDSIQTFFETIVKDYLKGFDRAYVAFSIGEDVQWTKNLNTSMDETIAALSGQ